MSRPKVLLSLLRDPPEGGGSLSGKESRTYRTIVRIVLAAYTACGWKLPPRGLAVGRAVYISRLCARNPDVWIPHIKAQCFLVRKASIEGSDYRNSIVVPRSFTCTREQLFQLSLIGRALPGPSKKVMNKALSEFIQTASYSHVKKFTPNNRFQILMNMEKERLAFIDKEEVFEPGFPGSSASSAHTRSSGGQLSEFSEFIGDSHKILITPPGKYPGAAMATRRRRDKLLKDKLKDFSRTRRENILRPTVLSEKGWKSRVVTSCSSQFVSEAHALRKKLFSLLMRHSQFRDYLGSSPKTIRLDPWGWVVSCDLKKATDGISHQALSWVCLELNLDPTLVYKQFYLQTEDSVRSYRRGCPMGMPCSWAILSLLHFIVLRSLGAHWFAIKGDDAIARLRKSQWLKYQSCMDMIGMPVNMTKTFISPTHGTFCERFYELKGEFLELKPSFALRCANREAGSHPIKDAEYAWRSSLLTTSRCHKISRIALTDTYDLCKRFKISKYMPSFYGGGGLPPPSENDRCSLRQEAIVRTIDTQGIGLPAAVRCKGTRIKIVEKALSKLKWSTSANSSCPHLERLVREVLNPAMVSDIYNGSYESIDISVNRYMRALKKQLSLIKPSYDSKMKGRRFIDMYQRDIQPSRESVERVFDHKCRDVKKWERKVFFPTYFAFF